LGFGGKGVEFGEFRFNEIAKGVPFPQLKTAPEGAVFASSAFQHCEIKQRWLPF
jgi:hypothetical protein